MFKIAVFLALVACAFAAPKPGAILAAEPVHVAPITSYANTYKVSYKSPALISSVAVAPLAPAVSYPAVAAYHAPLAYSAHPAHFAYAAPVAAHIL